MREMVEVYANNGRTVNVRADLAEAWLASHRECTRCKGHGSLTYHAAGDLWTRGWVLYGNYRCADCRGTGFTRTALKEASSHAD